MQARKSALTIDGYENGILSGDRATLARAITLVESSRAEDQTLAADLLTRLMPKTGRALRVGITGVPGAGKSTLIERLGTHLTSRDHKVAVLAVDPSSTRSGGSILGDKTRMDALSVDPNAFIRPSPTAGTLGGVASKSREAMLLCEAAGFDVVLIETVGVGQSELTVADMTDFFMVVMLSGAGDELQGIKRGLIELADMLVFNKADSGQEKRVENAASTYRSALHYTHSQDAPWQPPLVTCSALENRGIDKLWEHVEQYHEAMTAQNLFDAKRAEQQLRWMWSMVDTELRQRVQNHPTIRNQVDTIEQAVRHAELAPTTAARQILAAFLSGTVPRS